MRRTHTLEIPDGDGQPSDDDNDGIYLLGALVEGGKELVSTLEDVVFARGEDDAIDHNDARVRIARLWIDGFAHEGIAASAGRSVDVRDAEIRGCERGVEAGYGAPEVSLARAYVHDNDVGLRIGDSYAREVKGRITVESSVIVDNGTDLRNYSNLDMGPIEGALTLRCSWVGEGEAPGSCNGRGLPANACAVAASDCDCGAPLPPVCE